MTGGSCFCVSILLSSKEMWFSTLKFSRNRSAVGMKSNKLNYECPKADVTLMWLLLILSRRRLVYYYEIVTAFLRLDV